MRDIRVYILTNNDFRDSLKAMINNLSPNGDCIIENRGGV